MNTVLQFGESVNQSGIWQIASLVLIVAVVIVGIILLRWGWLWLQALFSGAPVNLFYLIGMSIRKVPASMIVNNYITLVKAGIDQPITELEKHYLAGGNVTKVVRAFVAASRAGLPLTLQRTMAIDLTGRDVLDAVETSVTPKVIDCPDPKKGKETIDAVAKDGIQLKVKARVTVRTNLERFVGGATEETIIARVGEGIVTTIGSAHIYKEVLENPDKISKTVLEKGLDAGTSFEILSIDIADVDVGVNVGAELQAAQAEADMRVARAKAEERRAAAVAREQEMVALTQESRAKVVLAEAEIPLAIAQAFREGKLGIFDYYSLKNIQADTTMRQAIGEVQAPTKTIPYPPEQKET